MIFSSPKQTSEIISVIKTLDIMTNSKCPRPPLLLFLTFFCEPTMRDRGDLIRDRNDANDERPQDHYTYSTRCERQNTVFVDRTEAS